MQLYPKPNFLPEFILHTRVNSTVEGYGLDTAVECLDKEHYKNYPHEVEYKFNDRGFRDDNWPTSNLDECIWCFGDSFTVGMGAPREHAWTYLLQEKTKKRTINVSMDGASNTWIARKTIQLIEEIRPKNVVIQWSYLHRREINDDTLMDEERRVWHDHIWSSDKKSVEDELLLTFGYIDTITELAKKYNTSVVHSFIPCFSSNENVQVFIDKCKDVELRLVEFKVLDLARDGHHYDIKTANSFTNNIVNSGLLSI